MLPEPHVVLYRLYLHQQSVAEVLCCNHTSQPYLHNFLRVLVALQEGRVVLIRAISTGILTLEKFRYACGNNSA